MIATHASRRSTIDLAVTRVSYRRAVDLAVAIRLDGNAACTAKVVILAATLLLACTLN